MALSFPAIWTGGEMGAGHSFNPRIAIMDIGNTVSLNVMTIKALSVRLTLYGLAVFREQTLPLHLFLIIALNLN